MTFNFPSATFVPSFQFDIRINPIHANYFSASDLAQSLNGAFGPDSFPVQAAVQPAAQPSSQASFKSFSQSSTRVAPQATFGAQVVEEE